MGLRLILGGSGSGKSSHIYNKVIEASIAYPEKNFMIIVPEQYTMQIQKTIVRLHPDHGVMNVDILSFNRLAHRIFDELGSVDRTVLEDIGKSMVIRRVMSQKAAELSVFKGNIKKQGFVGEMKSTVSELMQYHMTPKALEDAAQKASAHKMLAMKLQDIGTIYSGFKDYIEHKYITAEEILDRLTAVASQSALIKNSEIYLDEFTGFTPSQYKLLGELLKHCLHMEIALTIPCAELFPMPGPPFKPFYLTKETAYKLEKLCAAEHIEREADIYLKENLRYKARPDLSFLEAHLYRRGGGSIFDGEAEHIRILSAANPAQEIRFITQEILKLLRQGYRYRDMAVIAGDLSVYGHVVEQGFDKAGIPYFMDSKKSVLSNCLVEFIRALLEVLRQNFSYESVFRYLKTSLTDLEAEDIDRLENYVIAAGVRGITRWKKGFIKQYPGMQDGELDYVNQIREAAMVYMLPVYEAFKASDKTAAAYTDILTAFLQDIHMEERMAAFCTDFDNSGELALSKAYSQIYKVVADIFEKLKQIIGDEVMTVKAYEDILDAGFSEAMVGIIPPGIDQVMIGDIRRSRLNGTKILFFAGVNEGLVPGAVKEGGLIHDRDKEVLKGYHFELAPSGRQNLYTEQFYIYSVLTKPEDALYISYARADSSGRPLRPSSLTARIRAHFNGLKTEDVVKIRRHDFVYDKQEAVLYFIEGLRAYKTREMDSLWNTLYLWFREQDAYKEAIAKLIDAAFYTHTDKALPKAVVKALYGEVIEGSVTTLEKYAACAYAHFLTYGLMLKERREYRLDAPDLGIMFHSALEMFSSRLSGSPYSWQNMPDDYREALASECVHEVANTYNNTILLDNFRNKYFIFRLARMVGRTVWALQKQLKKGEFVPEGFEIRFDSHTDAGTLDIPLSESERMRLKGTIDRLDQYEQDDQVFVKVIDYKTGSKKFDLIALYYGLQLQLVVYMEAAVAMKQEKDRTKQVIPAGILYYNIDDPLIPRASGQDAEGVEDEMLKALKMNGLVNSDMNIIRLMDKEFDTASDVIPVALNKDGSLSKKSSAVPTKQFYKLFDYTSEKIKQIGRDILSGRIDVRPYRRKGKTDACAYCAYRAVCGFDESVEGYEFRRLMELSAESVWEKINKEAAGHGDNMDE